MAAALLAHGRGERAAAAPFAPQLLANAIRAYLFNVWRTSGRRRR